MQNMHLKKHIGFVILGLGKQTILPSDNLCPFLPVHCYLQKLTCNWYVIIPFGDLQVGLQKNVYFCHNFVQAGSSHELGFLL